MGLLRKLFGAEKKDDDTRAAPREATSLREGIPLGMKREEPMLTISEDAKEKIREVLASQNPAAECIRVQAPRRGKYAMELIADGKPGLDDTIIPFDGFQIFVDPHSRAHVEGASLDYVVGPNGAGFKFAAPEVRTVRPQARPVPDGAEGDIWRRIMEVLDSQVNPAVASHGGHIGLIEYREGVVYLEMSGGCQGCASSAATLRQGVERILRGTIPEIVGIEDVTNHSAGANPYYA